MHIFILLLTRLVISKWDVCSRRVIQPVTSAILSKEILPKPRLYLQVNFEPQSIHSFVEIYLSNTLQCEFELPNFCILSRIILSKHFECAGHWLTGTWLPVVWGYQYLLTKYHTKGCFICISIAHRSVLFLSLFF